MKNKQYALLMVLFIAILSSLIGYKIIYDNVDNNDINITLESDNTTKNKIENNEHIADNFFQENVVIPVEAIQEPQISPSTRLIWQTYFMRNNRLIEEEMEPPYYLLDMTREQVENYYAGEYQLISFSTKQVVVRKSLDESYYEYIVKAYNNRIYVYLYYKDKITSEGLKDSELHEYLVLEGYLKDDSIETPLSSFSEEEQKILREGINVEDEYELQMILESYTS